VSTLEQAAQSSRYGLAKYAAITDAIGLERQ
jgi:hypothetical protein